MSPLACIEIGVRLCMLRESFILGLVESVLEATGMDEIILPADV